jgi:hypothetical protein
MFWSLLTRESTLLLFAVLKVVLPLEVCPVSQLTNILVYNPQNVNDALQWATEGFCSEEVTVDPIARKATLSRLFSWYHADFGQTGKPYFISAYCF